MYWAGGCPSRVSRSGKPYPGAVRFMEPKKLHVAIPKYLIDWRYVVSCAAAGAGFLIGTIGLCVMLMLLI